MNVTEQIIRKCVEQTVSSIDMWRIDMWIKFLNSVKVKNMAEVGVFRGRFASYILKGCDSIEKYYMIDPWRHLDDWVKPENKDNELYERFLSETKAKTDFAAEKRIILRGKTIEVIEKISDGELDFAYIDGDHTLKGISIDLIRVFPKIKDGGWIGGDDFVKNLWQHSTKFEPTLVNPFAVYFAEAVGARIYALPKAQFLMEKNVDGSFAFIDLTGRYQDTALRDKLMPSKILKLKLKEKFPFITKVVSYAKRLVLK